MEVLDILASLPSLLDMRVEHVPDRPNQDNGYEMESSVARKILDWYPESNVTARIKETGQWFVDNTAWWRSIIERNPKLLSKQPWLEKW